jgi:hypothetical protein
VYNILVQSRNKVKNSWSQIDVQLKRRFDLITNIVETNGNVRSIYVIGVLNGNYPDPIEEEENEEHESSNEEAMFDVIDF